jgi:hypothetical protein
VPTLNRSALIESLVDQDSATIKVSQWKPFADGDGMPEMGQPNRERARSYCLLSYSQHDADDDGGHNCSKNSDIEMMDEIVAPLGSHDSVISEVSADPFLEAHEGTLHRRKITEPDLGESDLWDTDVAAQEACRHGHFMEPSTSGHYDVTGGDADSRTAPVQRHRRQTSVASSTPQYHRQESTASGPFVNEGDEEVSEHIKERLHGYVRQMASTVPGHRRQTSAASASLFHRRRESTLSNPVLSNETPSEDNI